MARLTVWEQAAGGSGANSPIDPWQHGHEGGAERGDRMDHSADLTPGSAHCTYVETAWLGVGLRAD